MKGKLFLFLFALPFFGVGAWMGYSIASHIHEAWQMKSWVAVDASISAGGYEVHSGDDSDTYEAYAQYSYNFDGRSYHGDRVSITGGSDNIGEYQRDLGRRLSDAASSGRTVVAFVDPADPSSAVLDRNLRWGLLGFKAIFFFVFGGVGLGLIIWVLVSPRGKELSSPGYASRPWLANDDWRSGTIRSGSRSTMWLSWGFAAIWNLISAPLPFVVYSEFFEKDNPIALVGLLFPLVGIGLLWWAIKKTLEWRRFGAAPVTLDPFPGSIGGHVGGTIDIGLPYDPGARFSVTLTSLHSYVSGSGDNRSRKEKANWQETQIAYASSAPGGTRVQFRFDVPDGLDESDVDQTQDSYDLWRLNLNADLPGTDIDRDYVIPVYATGEQSQSLHSFPVESARSQQRTIDLEAIRKLFSMEEGIDGRRLLYPMLRNSWNGLVGFVFGAIFAGTGWYLVFRVSHWLMGAVFGLIGGLIALSGLYFLFNSLEVVQRGDSIRSVRRILGIPVRCAEMRRSEFRGFERKVSMSTRSGSKHTVFFKVFATGASGRKLVVGEGFRGAGQAQAAEDFIADRLGLVVRDNRPARAQEFDDRNFLVSD
jgi:hypothetical protein